MVLGVDSTVDDLTRSRHRRFHPVPAATAPSPHPPSRFHVHARDATAWPTGPASVAIPTPGSVANPGAEAPTAAGVKEHVASCSEVGKIWLRFWKSLLRADGPDGSGLEATSETEPVKETAVARYRR